MKPEWLAGFALPEIWILLLSTVLAVAASLLAMAIARKIGAVAPPPSNNPCHVGSPRLKLGGLAVLVAGLLVTVVVIGLWSHWRTVVVFASGLALIGLLDDRHPLTPGWKIILQAPIAMMVVLWLDRPYWIPMGIGWVAFETAYLVVMTNAFNIIDVADGLLPGLASILLITIGALLLRQPGMEDLGVIGLSVGGATAGMLLFNVWPGRLILGDFGSLPLGGLASLLALYVDLPLPMVGRAGTVFLFLLVPFVEVAVVSYRRISHGIPPWQGSPHHVVYWLVERGLKVPDAVLLVVLAQAVPLTAILVWQQLWLALAAAGLVLAMLALVPRWRRPQTATA